MRLGAAGFSFCLIFGLAACNKPDVTSYRIPKEAPEAGLPSAMQAPPPIQPENPTAPPEGQAPETALRWKTPPGWKETPGSGMRYATLVVPAADGGSAADVSIVVLPGPAGGFLANANRWRGQVGLPPLGEGELKNQIERVKSLAGTLLLLEMEGTLGDKRTKLLGAILETNQKTWFFKLTGDPRTVGKAKPTFHEFLKSLHASSN